MSGIYRGPNSSVAAQFVNADGDKGDIVVSNSGASWTIDAEVVDSSKVSTIVASKITNIPSGNLTSSNVQDSLVELQLELDTKLTGSGLSDHVNSVSDAHDASAISNAPLGNLVATNVQSALYELQIDVDTKVDKTSSTGSAILPASTTANRDGTPLAGYIRFNTTLNQFEGYNGTAWGAIGGGATGGVGDSVFYQNDQTITADYTIPTGQNAMTAGDITIDGGVTVTIPSGSKWTIVG